MSSISQMERSSSQTRMLAMDASPCSHCGSGGLRCDECPGFICHVFTSRAVVIGGCALSIEATQAEDERGSLPRLRSRPNLAFMGLHNLVDDGQAEAGAAF